MTVVYTPGHGLVADTLIMHGVVRALAHMGIYDAWVERVGERYRIEFEGKPRKLVETDIGEALLRSAKLYLTEGVLKDPLRKINDTNPNFSVFRSWVSDLAEAVSEADLLDFTPDHRERRREGRSRSKALITLHISLSSVYGKYYPRDFLVTEGVQYSVCGTCFAFANVGLTYGAAALVAREGNDLDVVLMSVAPVDRVAAVDLLVMQRLTEGYTVLRGRGAPLLAAPMYWLSTGETLYAVDAELDLVVWRVGKSGNFIRSLDVVSIPVDNLMTFVAEVKRRVKAWPRLVKTIMQHAPETLARLTEFVIYGGDLYGVIRELATLRCYEKQRHGEELCVGEAASVIADVLVGLKAW